MKEEIIALKKRARLYNSIFWILTLVILILAFNLTPLNGVFGNKDIYILGSMLATLCVISVVFYKKESIYDTITEKERGG